MTDILVKKTSLGREISVKGHSGDGVQREGSVVCAAISTLAQTIAQNLYDYENEGEADIVDISLKSGEAFFSYITDNESVNGVVDGLCKGFMLISESFPERVTFDII
ncbi:MAG: ribosomal-processing cysteine protease Prp [Ruminiclostridium sp.]|nr:ribosomal-processing cysteine protease Prp [Ruminiclostridium sp.]